VRMAASVGLERLAGQTAGMSPADLANVINEAALLAARERRPEVHDADLDAALLRVVAGPAMTSRLLSPALKRVVAYHEVGHALVMKMLLHCDPVTKVQAIPRGIVPR
jgi:cell division protease FtsH